MDINIIPADFSKHLLLIKSLFEEYASTLGFSLDFQNFADEINTINIMYSPPEGNVYLAFADQTPAGCIAVRKLEKNICEMKRLYVKPKYRGFGIGKSLAQKSIQFAKESDYKLIKLDTVRSMSEAIGMYKKMGFIQTAPYNSNPLPDAVFFTLYL
jgi:putative acetyltransferase